MPSELEQVIFFGRSFQQYLDFFDLDRAALSSLRILDCGSGPSSFTAFADQVAESCIAVDPLYENSPEELKRIIGRDAVRLRKWVKQQPDLELVEVENFKMKWQETTQLFLDHFKRRTSCYVDACLPQLPFCENEFELVLCANFLMIYSNTFSDQFHEKSLRELLRVSNKELRVFPTKDYAGIHSAYLENFFSIGKEMNFKVTLEPSQPCLVNSWDEYLRFQRIE